MEIEIVIPIFNEEEVLEELHASISRESKKIEHNFFITFINDGSTDNTLSVLKSLKKNSEIDIKIINLSRNFGPQAAVNAGIDNFSKDVCIFMDGDLQDNPGYFQEMINKWEEGYKIVLAKRIDRKENFFRKIIFNIFYKIQKFNSEIYIPVNVGHYSLLDKKAMDVLRLLPEKLKYLNGLRAFIGFRTTNIEVVKDKRYAGTAKMSYSKLFKFGFQGLLSFSKSPLLYVLITGISMSSISLLIFIIQLLNNDPNVLLVSLYFCTGIIITSIGLLGQYLGLIFKEVKSRPSYIIENVY
jgi:dolichol-phosphate mannosyltransferase